jgi:hypothetical protein
MIYDAHEEYAAMEGERYPAWWLRLMTATENALARKAALIVVPGASRLPRWRAAGFGEPLVMPNAGPSGALGAPDGIRWDIVYCGSLTEARRLDILIEVADRRPDINIAVAGRGRLEGLMRREESRLPNLAYLGWAHRPTHMMRQSRAVYYGLDPSHPYADKACPNNLYQALDAERPLIFFCGGEPGLLASRYRIGIRCNADAENVADAIDHVRLGARPWQFVAAREAVDPAASTQRYVGAVLAVLDSS